MNKVIICMRTGKCMDHTLTYGNHLIAATRSQNFFQFYPKKREVTNVHVKIIRNCGFVLSGPHSYSWFCFVLFCLFVFLTWWKEQFLNPDKIGINSVLCHLPSVCPWTSFLNSVSISSTVKWKLNTTS